MGTLEDWEEVLEIRYYSELSKIKIMTKKAMLQEGFKSPDLYDAGALCFTREFYEVEREKEEDPEPFDPYTVL